MKLALCYFDTAVSRMFVEKTDEKGEKTVVLSSPHNFVYRDEILAKIINVEDPVDAELQIDKGYSFHVVEKNPNLKAGEGVYYDQFSSTYKASGYGFVILTALRRKSASSPRTDFQGQGSRLFCHVPHEVHETAFVLRYRASSRKRKYWRLWTKRRSRNS